MNNLTTALILIGTSTKSHILSIGPQDELIDILATILAGDPDFKLIVAAALKIADLRKEYNLSNFNSHEEKK